jgi:2-dehydro-3-deoxyphosphogalactonate aldolase
MNAGQPTLEACLGELPLIAILRGVSPEEAVPVTEALYEEGFRIVEVPMNSPRPLDSIGAIADGYGNSMLVGAGTVMSAADVEAVAGAGGRLIVSPHFDPEVVGAAKRLGLYCTPGIQTPSEAFAALRAGADGLKVFPAEACPPVVIKAIRAVLPKETLVMPVGGINENNMAEYWRVNANGFGIGSNLYKAGKTIEEVRAAARVLAGAARAFMNA